VILPTPDTNDLPLPLITNIINLLNILNIIYKTNKKIYHQNMEFKRTIIFAIIITLIDIPWIKYVMGPQYSGVFDIKMKPAAAFMAYLCMIICYPLIISKFRTLKDKIIIAATIGFVIYGTYGFTLAAIYEKYPVYLAIMETLWGTTLFTITTFLTHKIKKYI